LGITVSTNVGTFGFGFQPISIPKVQNIKIFNVENLNFYSKGK
jgi:hypothetical protein